MTTTNTAKKSRKATHKGICQCCGRLQKLPYGRLSQHGYTVTWGFFNGVCGGAEHLPLELDRTELDRTVKLLRNHAEDLLERDPTVVYCDVARTSRYVGRQRISEGGLVKFDDFDEFRKLAIENRDKWGKSFWKKGFDYSTLTTSDVDRLVEEYGSVEEQEEKTIIDKFMAARKNARRQAKANAEAAIRHADYLVDLADKVHGQPLKHL